MDSSKTDIWGNVSGDYVVRHKTDTWQITVFPENSSGESDALLKDWTDPVTHPSGTIGENVAGTIEELKLNEDTGYMGLIAVKRNNLWGFADRNLKLVIPFQYDSANAFVSPRFGKVSVGGQQYYINEKGEYLIRLTRGIVYTGVEAKGTVIALIAAPGFNNGKSIPTERYNCAGIRITEEEYQKEASVYNANLAAAGGLTYYSSKSSEIEWAFTKNNGNGTSSLWKMKAPKGFHTSRNFREGLLVVENENGLKGAVDKSGNIVIGCQYQFLSDSSGGYLVGKMPGQSRTSISLVKNTLYPSVTVKGTKVSPPEGNDDTCFSVSLLMSSKTLPGKDDVKIAIERGNGVVCSAPVSDDGGRTWKFSLKDSAGMTASYLIEMTEVIEKISLNTTNITLKKGEKYQLRGMTAPEHIKGVVIRWSSSNSRVVKVSQNGEICAVGKGKASVTAECNKLTASCTVTVTDSKEPPASDSKKPSDEKKIKTGDTVKVGKVTYKVINARKKTVEYKKTSSTSKTVSIPKTVKIKNVSYKVSRIGNNAFKGKKKITKVTIGSNVEQIGNNVFSGCSKLKTVSLPSKLTKIGEKSFYKCTSLTKIVMPSKVSSIGKSAFYGDKKLKDITIKTTKLTAKNVGAKSFQGTHKKAVVRVPKKKQSAYKRLLKSKGMSKSVSYKRI